MLHYSQRLQAARSGISSGGIAGMSIWLHPSSVEMWESKDYVEKFGPMLGLLDSEGDFDFLASKKGYHPDVARNYRDMRRRAVRSYLAELLSDFQELYDIAAPIAVADRELAAHLTRAKSVLRRSVRYIRTRLLLDGFIPPPAPNFASGIAKASGIVRRVLVHCIPRPVTPQKLLEVMNTIREQLIRHRASGELGG